MTTSFPSPKRGEVWLVDFNPTRGAEIQKRRPAVVISSDSVGKLPLKLVVPITDWKSWYAGNIWHVKITPDGTNGVTKDSAIDALQVKSVDVERFIQQMGRMPSTVLEEVAAAIAAVIEHV